MKRAVFPGTFDPITLGHTDIINRALLLFDEIIVAIGMNAGKQPMFEAVQRIQWIHTIYNNDSRVKAMEYTGLTIELCRQQSAGFIVRGIRNNTDYEYEKTIADMNHLLAPEIETVFLACSPSFASFSSTVVRDVIRHKGNTSFFLPEAIHIQ
ncbi:MAG TPA: pantetheine-phosphate adenylyltransferase [Chitinophagaceae bacterium]|nr:pantetheine-phosphate adenylyltransferase [Chitinophagaceae bacterium]